MDRERHQQWLDGERGRLCVDNLKKHRFDAVFFQTVAEARTFLKKVFADFKTFGFGGSDTTRSLGLDAMLAGDGKVVIDHLDPELSAGEQLQRRKQQVSSDCFVCSANAISLTGEVVNVDGIGNRTNAMCFGPKKVVIVAGMNKVTPNLESAIRRVREKAAPMRAHSLGMNTPCAQTGVCVDCNSPQRICNITTILHRRPLLTDITIVLIGETLGY